MTAEPGTRTLGSRAARGAFVTLSGQGFKIVVQLLSVVVLARLLSPHDYGLLAMVTAIIGVADIFRDFGLSMAAIQAKSLSRVQRDNLVWVNSGIGVLLATLTFCAAPLIAKIYGQPDLTNMTRALAGTFLISGLATQYRADLNRRLLFSRLVVADVCSPVAALAVAVALGVMGAGHWALVAQQLVQAFVMLLLVMLGAGWLPSPPRRNTPMASLFHFGWTFASTQLVGYASNNIDSLIIGVRFGAGPLGLYNRAFQLVMTPLGQLRAPSMTVALPVLSKLQDDDLRFGEYVKRGQLALGYTLVAGLGLLVGAAAPISAVLLGDRWASVTPIIRLLAIAGVFQTLAYVGYWVYVSKNMTKDLLRYSLVSAAIKGTCIAVGSTWGINGVATGYAVAPAIAWPLSFWWLSKRAEIPLRDLVLGALRIAAVTLSVGLAAWLASTPLESLGTGYQLAAGCSGGAAAYALLGLCVRPVREDMRSVFVVMGRSLLNR